MTGFTSKLGGVMNGEKVLLMSNCENVAAYSFLCFVLWIYLLVESLALGREMQDIRKVYAGYSLTKPHRFRMVSDMLILLCMAYSSMIFPHLAVKFHIAILLVMFLVLLALQLEFFSRQYGFILKLLSFFSRLILKPLIYGGIVGFLIAAFGKSHYAFGMVVLCAITAVLSYLLLAWTSWKSLQVTSLEDMEAFYVLLLVLCVICYLSVFLLTFLDNSIRLVPHLNGQMFHGLTFTIFLLFFMSFAFACDMVFYLGRYAIHKLLLLCSVGMVFLFIVLYPAIIAFEYA